MHPARPEGLHARQQRCCTQGASASSTLGNATGRPATAETRTSNTPPPRWTPSHRLSQLCSAAGRCLRYARPLAASPSESGRCAAQKTRQCWQRSCGCPRSPTQQTCQPYTSGACAQRTCRPSAHTAQSTKCPVGFRELLRYTA
eukprot:1030795-Alexandrium_andersonii.AAC.1